MCAWGGEEVIYGTRGPVYLGLYVTRLTKPFGEGRRDGLSFQLLITMKAFHRTSLQLSAWTIQT